MKLAFIGGGNMGEAMLSAIIASKLTGPGSIFVSDIKEERLEYLKQSYGVAVTADNVEAAENGDIVVLAIKPQNLSAVMAEMRGRLGPSQLALSIIAGARIKTLSQGLEHDCIVRIMPNTPAQIGQGMSVWTATESVSEEQRKWAGAILGTMGKETYVADERHIDMATAISGSGPAYVFLFVESLVEAAVNIGLPADIANVLALQTLLGSAIYLEKSGRAPAELRKMVTSPGGTTAEALLRFEKGGFTELVREAVNAAYNRATQLGEQKG